MTTVAQYTKMNEALAIAGRVALAHNITVDVLRNTKSNREINAARAEFADLVRTKLHWGVRMTGKFLNVSPRSVCNLLAAREGRKTDIIAKLEAEIRRKDAIIRELRKATKERAQ
jgi:hypothetical protein